jgi:hypothetical protein
MNPDLPPNENETRPCAYPGCGGTQTFMLKADIAGSRYGLGTERGTIWPIPQLPAWLCDQNREHYELSGHE